MRNKPVKATALLSAIRRANTDATTRYSIGGREKRRKPKPITLTRAQYEANKASDSMTEFDAAEGRCARICK